MNFFSAIKSDTESKDQEIEGGVLAVRGRCLVVQNRIYQISNISTISVVDLSADRRLNPLYPILTVGGLFLALFASEGTRALGVLIFLVAGVAWIYKYLNRRVINHALTVLMNAGNRLVLMSPDNGFLKRMALALYSSISTDHPASVTFNLDQRQIFDNISQSTISTGNVTGDIVNNV